MRHRWRLAVSFWLFALSVAQAQVGPDSRYPFYAYLTGKQPALITYTPSELDPRQPINQVRLKTSSIRKDLTAIRTTFDGLVLYGYHEACTPRILAVARDLKYRAVLLAVWDPKSTAELDGVADLVRQYESQLALAVLIGNEGITFSRYEEEDLTIAAERLRFRLGKRVPISTSEPLVGYKHEFVRRFGDFLAPNIHPVFDRPQFGPAEAAAWAREQATELSKQTGKSLLLKETGFPHDGKPAYTAASQQAFWAAYLKPGALIRAEGDATRWQFYGVAFEAFDLPWKSEESKLAIEKSWGFFSPRREPYPVLSTWREALPGAGSDKTP